MSKVKVELLFSKNLCHPSFKLFSSLELKGQAVVRRRRRLSTLSKDILFEATGPFKPKFHLWQLWARR